MNILIINAYGKPNQKNEFPFPYSLLRKILYYPSGILEEIATLTPKDYNVTFIDEGLNQKINFDMDYDIVGISCIHTPSSPRAYYIADEFRKRKKTVILGGYHPSALPEEAKQHADAVVIGEAERNWPKLLQDFSENKLKPFYSQDESIDLNNVPIRDKKYLTKKNYFFRGVYTSRGCPYGCNFCSISNTKFGCIFRKRPLEKVIEEIKLIPQKNLVFNDSSLSIDIEYSKKLFREMKNLNKKFRCWMNLNIPIDDKDFLKLASEAGCRVIEMGFESVSQNTIDALGKKTNIVKKYKEIVKKIHDYGIAISGLFIAGLDSDKKEDLGKKYIDDILSIDLDSPRVALCTPLPGTPLFHQLEKEGRILTRDWVKYDMMNVIFKPKHMTPEELHSRWINIMEELYTTSNCLDRLFNKNRLKMSSKLWSLFYNISFNRIVSSTRQYQF